MTLPLSVDITGVVLPDGSLSVPSPIGLPAGPVRISVETVAASPESSMEQREVKPTPRQLLPDPPIMDWAITTPCDLPMTGPFERVTPREIEVRLPEAHDIDETME